MIYLVIFGVHLYLVYFIIGHVDPEATSFSTIGQDATYAVYALIAIFIFGRIRRKSSSE